MNTTLIIAGRELREKSRIFITAAALATLPFLATLLPGARAWGRQEMIAAVAGLLSLSMAIGVSAILGGSIVGRELSDGRLSFYFSKPIAPAALWFGKAIAALVTALGSFFIIAAPAMLVAKGLWAWMFALSIPVVIAVAGAASVAVFFVLHAIATMVRSRSKLLALDFALAAVTVGVLFVMVRPIMTSFAIDLLRVLGLAIAIAFVIILAIAPVWQLEWGRTDRRRSHAALSKFLWPAIGVVLLIAGAYVTWVVMATPDDLEPRTLSVTQSPVSGWTFLEGYTPGRLDYRASFLVSPDGKRSVRVPPIWWGTAFSRNGNVAAWVQPVRFSASEVYIARMSDPRPVSTGIRAGQLGLSDDGRLMAAISGGTISVHDLETKRMLFSSRLPIDVGQMFFPTPGVVRMFEQARHGKPARIYELDFARRALTKTGQFGDGGHVVASPDGSRMLLPRLGLVVDGRTGATIQEVERGHYGSAILRDNTVVVATRQRARIKIYEPNAAPRELVLPGIDVALVRGEIAPGKLGISGYTAEKSEERRWRQFVVDRRTGAIERVEENLSGAAIGWRQGDPRPLPYDTGKPLVMLDADGKLVKWDPRTGARSPLLQN